MVGGEEASGGGEAAKRGGEAARKGVQARQEGSRTAWVFRTAGQHGSTGDYSG